MPRLRKCACGRTFDMEGQAFSTWSCEACRAKPKQPKSRQTSVGEPADPRPPGRKTEDRTYPDWVASLVRAMGADAMDGAARRALRRTGKR